DADADFRIAAIRETLEESGIPVGIAPDIDPDLAAKLQARLHDGANLGELLASHGLSLDLEALAPFARWKPAFHQARIFDTIFFIAEAPGGEWRPRPQAGGGEAAEWPARAEGAVPGAGGEGGA